MEYTMNVIDFHNEVDKEISPKVSAKLHKTVSEIGTIMAEGIERMMLKAFLKTDSFKPDTPSEEPRKETL